MTDESLEHIALALFAAMPAIIAAIVTALTPPPLNARHFYLSGIVTQPGPPLALVNDRVLYVGDWIDEARVVDISSTGVILARNNDRVTLYLSR